MEPSMHSGATPIHYRLSLARPAAHVFEVRCTIAEPDAGGQCLRLPAWIPGSYMIRDFARNIISIRACNDEGPVALHRVDKSTWQCDPCAGPLYVDYEVYAWDLSVRAAHFDQTHAYFNGASLFLAAVGQEARPCQLTIPRPEHAPMRDWQVATSLDAGEDTPRHGFGSWHAPDYDALIDHPFEIGALTLAEFEVAGVPHEIALYGRHEADMARLVADLRTICQTHVDFFGELPPMSRYVFLVMVVGDGYGGLEHRSSCSLLCSREDLPHPADEGVTDKYRGFLGLCSHEYFHTWNIKRIKPEIFMPYRLERETHTTLLWAFEGITSYYDDLGLLRSGLIPLESYLELLGQTVTRVMRGPGRFRQSIAESSFDAWTRFYRQDENAANAIVSYYAKGALVALALDLRLRRDSGGRASLDDLMRRLWREYGRPGIGLPEGRIEAIAGELAGGDMQDFFAAFVYGHEDPPLGELLAELGIVAHQRARSDLQDKGGKPAEDPFVVDLAAVLRDCDEGLRIQSVTEDGPAQQAGLSAGDLIVAIDGLRTDCRRLASLLRRRRPGDTLEVHYFRRDELFQTTVALAAAPRDTWYFRVDEHADAAARARRAAWRGEPA